MKKNLLIGAFWSVFVMNSLVCANGTDEVSEAIQKEQREVMPEPQN